jgi:hypothetical protein
VHAVLNACVCLPLHLVFIRSALPARDVPPASRDRARADAAPGAFFWLATAFSLAAFLASAISAHLVVLLAAGGLAARDAVIVGALIGPMQVAGRAMEFAFAHRFTPLAVGTFAFALFATALILLSFVHGVWLFALAFALLYGWANGLMTIVRGTVPGVLFGSRTRHLAGRLAQPQFILKAHAPSPTCCLPPERKSPRCRALTSRRFSRWRVSDGDPKGWANPRDGGP